MPRLLGSVLFLLLLSTTPLFASEPPIGQTVFKEVCATCHATGLAGAPVVGNKEDWKARIDQGLDTLVQHAINGFQGEHGFMPARGGQPKLSDQEVKSAVEFMVEQSR